MASIRPFQALRPVPDVAARVSSVPYDVVNTEEARAQAAATRSASSTSSVPRSTFPPAPIPYADEVYAQAVRELRGAAARGAADPRSRAGPYFYRLRMGGHEQTGLAAATRSTSTSRT